MKKLLLTLSILLVFPALSFANSVSVTVYTLIQCGSSCYVEGSTTVTDCSGTTATSFENGGYYFFARTGYEYVTGTFDASLCEGYEPLLEDGTTNEQTILEDGTIIDTEKTHLNGVLVSEIITTTSPDGTVTVQSTTINPDGSPLQDKEEVTTENGWKETIKDYTEEGWDYYQVEENTVDGVITGTTRAKSCTESVEFGITCTEVDENIYQMYEEIYESEIQYDEQTNITIQTETITNPQIGVTEIITTETDNNTGEVSQTTSVVDNEVAGESLNVDIDLTETNELLQGIKDNQQSIISGEGAPVPDTPDVSLSLIPTLDNKMFDSSVSAFDETLVDTTYIDKIRVFVEGMADSHPLVALAKKEHFTLSSPACSFSVTIYGKSIVIDFCKHIDVVQMFGNVIVLVAGVYSLFIALGRA